MTILFTEPSFVPVSGNSVVYPGAKLYFYATETSTPQNTYSEYTLTTAHANPVVADADGRFAPIYLDPSLEDYKVVLKDSSDVTIWTVDPYSAINNTTRLGTMSDLLSASTALGTVSINGYHTAGDGGSGMFYWDASQDRANHNGGTIIDPTRTFDWTNTTTITTWFTASTGTGCWMRITDGTINTAWFGAKGDGTQNDSLSFTYAMASAPAGGIVETTRPGTYILNNLFAPKAIEFRSGLGVIYKLPANTNQHILRFLDSSTDGSSVDGGYWDGNQSNQSVRDGFNGLIVISNSSATKGYKVINASFNDAAGYGVSVSNTEAVVIDRNLIKNTDNAPIFINVTGTNSKGNYRITNNEIDQSTQAITRTVQTAIKIARDAGATVAGFVVANNIVRCCANTTTDDDAIGIEIEGIRGAITGNYCYDGFMGISLNQCEDVTVTGNVIFHPNQYGIEVPIAKNNTVTGNVVHGDSTTNIGISVTSSTNPLDNNVISGNTIHDCTQYGISVAATSTATADEIVIAGNVITGSPAINLTGADLSTISGNLFQGTGNAISFSDSNKSTISGNTFVGYTNILAYSNASPVTVTDIVVSGNNWGATPTNPFVNLSNTTFGDRCSSRGNSPNVDILDVGQDIRDGWISGAPTGTPGNGSTYRREDGGSGTTFYVYEGGAWVGK